MQKLKSLIWALIPLVTWGCFENESLTESQIVVDGDELELRLIEYTDVSGFTYFDDSLASNASGSFLLGKHYEPYRGTVQAIPYMEMGLNGVKSIDEEAVLDSTVLVLFYNNYHYDTLQGFDIEVYELLEEMEADDDGYIYSFQEYEHSSSPLHSSTVRVIPHRDSLTITMPVDFGQRLFEKGKEKEGLFESNENLWDTFLGLVLKVNEQSPLVSFTSQSYLGFYYRIPSDLDQGADQVKLMVSGGENHFTHLNIDRNSDYFIDPRPYTNIPMESSGEMMMADQLMGAFMRIEVPNIHELLEISGDYYITSASLRLPIKPNTYDQYLNIPVTSVNVWVGDKKNNYIQSLGTISLNSWDEQFQEKTYYVIPIKSFLDYKLSQGINNQDALIITVPTSGTTLGLQSLHIAENSSEQKIKIDITFLPLN
ncbi:hypothetical protein GCM10007049_20920 [Echinicola pacifica]|uniref:DUF4270 family protein n=1 Tax=Echinicola pacifica TaxID=346377 RepID=A0A918PYY8_9BACT|nr:DUF4270 family protein [Echinicola pacifica]GGZ27876.1 hypothetical protein GCM10007049_20920 [Echinicola pacifica]